MYKPLINDYVRWETRNLEGWVYYVDNENEYITIEIAVTDKLPHQLDAGTCHRKNHVLIVCQSYYWHELVFLKSRPNAKSEDHV